MNSSTHRKQDEDRQQAEIRKQIAALQAQLKDEPASLSEPAAPTTPRKRKQQDYNLLVPETPSAKKPRAEQEPPSRHASTHRPGTSNIPARNTQANSSRDSHPFNAETTRSCAPSTVLAKLASMNSNHAVENSSYTIERSSGFRERAPTKPTAEQDSSNRAPRRGDDLALIEDLEPGPYDHKAPFDDPHFQKLEPHSGIRLSSRAILHDDLQDYLRGRYYLSPSRLYSVIRLLPSKQGYDVPVEGDWVTIAVIAERGPMRYSRAPVGIGKEDGEELPEDDVKNLSLDAPAKPVPSQFQQRWKGKAKEEPSKPSGKRYVNLKLIDFGCRSKSSATAEKAVIRGDAFLSLLLFESDSVEEITREDGKKEKLYKGGSRGAFERMAKLKEGAVVAFLNPKILKPYQRAGDKPHPSDNILAITPESVDSVAVIGQSQDLGMCTVVKRDGKVCGGWCDKRVSDVCDWHIQNAVQRKRAGRAEFSVGTSGMTTVAKRKPAYDPAKQWGLKPEPERSSGAGEATYVVSGHIVAGGASKQSLFISEDMGRDAQAKAARKTSAKDADLVLQKLLKRDKEGMKVVAAAREHGKKMEEQLKKSQGESTAGNRKKGKVKAKDAGIEKALEPLSNEENADTTQTGKDAYSVGLIRSIGFDPTDKNGRKSASTNVQKKLDTLASLQSSRKGIFLGPRPGKLKTTVRAPENVSAPVEPKDSSASAGEDWPALSDESNDELGSEIATSGLCPTTTMVDLDSSDIELEVEPA